ncbi:MAG TPA: polyprenyl diphosphate synthase [Alcanivoracaceae bacterium]|nr:polyprenyl diphosphate synthase [Alcanivoracaceae bacterium]
MPHTSHAPDIDSHKGSIPRHLAIIMDGNNRWAQRRSLPGAEGHKAGEQAVQAVIEASVKQGIEVLTLFAFSSENWRRPEEEVQHLMALFLQALQKRVAELHENNVRIRFMGELSAFSDDLRAGMRKAEEQTRHNDSLTVVVAVNYGGQWDIAQAARAAAEQVQAGAIQVADITDAYLGAQLYLADLPPVDLLIRTGGEYRISNFMLWQVAYSELYFTDELWPDFDERSLEQAVVEYSGRQRRFGRSGAEVAQLTNKKG